MYNNEHYDIDMSDKIIFCKDRSTGYNFKKNGTQDLIPRFSRTDCFKCSFFFNIKLISRTLGTASGFNFQ